MPSVDELAANFQTQAMCKAWRLFRDHGREAETIVDAELMRCLRAGDTAGAADWRDVAEALTEWCR
jgi:hypothetical protein